MARCRIGKPKRLPNVDGEDDNEGECQIKEVPVDVLHDERERPLTEICFSRLAYGAGGRISPEGFVIGAAIVVAGQSEAAGRPQNQKGGRKQKPGRPPDRFWSKPAMR